MKHIILIMCALISFATITSASPTLDYSTMVVDHTEYRDAFSRHGWYATDIDLYGNLYLALPYKEHIAVFRIDPSGSIANLVVELSEYQFCKQIDWKESGIYARVAVNKDFQYFEQFVKFTLDGNLIFNTNFPNNFMDDGDHHFIDDDGNIFVAFNIHSEDEADQIPVTVDAFDSNYNGSYDIVIQKYSLNGELLYSTFLGGSGYDFINSITVDKSGVIFLGCANTSSDFPIPFENPWAKGSTLEHPSLITISPEFDDIHAYYSTISWYGRISRIGDAFYNTYLSNVFKYTFTDGVVSWIDLSEITPVMRNPSLLLKVTASVVPYSAVIDNQRQIYSIHKEQASTSFTITSDALYPSPHGDTDLGIWQVTDNAELLYGTYFGGSGIEETTDNAIAFRDGKLYVVGYTNSPDFPLTPGSYIDSRPAPVYGQDYPWGLFAFCIDFNEPTEVADELSAIPEALILDPPHPNPFNPTTTISFTLPKAGFARLAVYNISGQLVRELTADHLPAGRHEIVWDGRDSDGVQVGSGVYIARLAAGGRTAVRKVTLVR